MLAYVFWHRPRDDADTGAYERADADLHRSLQRERAGGLIESATARVGELPRLKGGGYEDWYVVPGYAGLGELAAAAATGAHADPHGRAAGMLAEGTAGLYEHLDGDGGVAHATHATWVERPPGARYPALADLFSGADGPFRAGLWRRALVLGPAPELCVLHDANFAPAAPDGWRTFTATREAP
ncbi:MAG TPA: hypothetical protein VMA83_02635 [Solirubrobacteraceae bacterium]|nr:hypothetical protein [Solirubrobacteraceae bacterium]